MPGDGFAFPVRVGSQVDGFGALGGLGELLDGVLLVLWDFVERCEVFGNVDAEPVLGEVPDMAQGGHYVEVLAQYLLDGPGLGGRFYNYEIFSHKGHTWAE